MDHETTKHSLLYYMKWNTGCLMLDRIWTEGNVPGMGSFLEVVGRDGMDGEWKVMGRGEP